VSYETDDTTKQKEIKKNEP